MAQIGAVGSIAETTFSNGGMGAGPNLLGMTLVNAQTGGGGGGGGGDQVGAGQSISPN